MLTAAALVLRELRTESRRPWNYWARVAAGAVVTATFMLTLGPRFWSTANGARLFYFTSSAVQDLIWLIVPLLTADCLSKEKREGTLGLLFLTPLTASEIVVGKSIVHALRASSVILAGVPVLALCILLGGVTLGGILFLLLDNLAALFLAMAAGLLASSCARDWLRSVLLTAVLATIFWSAFSYGIFGIALPGGLTGALMTFAFAGGVLFLCGFLAAVQIRRTWQQETPSKLMRWWLRTFCSPIFWKELFFRSSRVSLEQNPVGWLHERTATARATKWIWCCAAVFVTSMAVGSSDALPYLIAFEIGLGLAMAFAGASSFHKERENGVLELLLVAPLKVDGIIAGRLRSLLKQFSPAVMMVVILGFSYFILVGSYLGNSDSSMLLPHGFLLMTSFALLPALGLYAALRMKRFLSAWLLACLVGLAGPYFAASFFCSWPDQSIFGWMAIFQVWLGLWTIKRLRGGLTRTSLALQT